MGIVRSVVSVTLALFPVFYFGITADAAKMGIAAAAGAASAMLLNFDRLKSLKLGIMEAQLAEKILEATATLDDLRELAAAVIAVTMRKTMLDGRWGGGMKGEARISTVERLRSAADRLGIADTAEIREANHEVDCCRAYDLFVAFHHGCKDYPTAALNGLSGAINFYEQKPPDRGTIMAILGSHGVDALRPEDQERLEDYLFFREHRLPRI